MSIVQEWCFALFFLLITFRVVFFGEHQKDWKIKALSRTCLLLAGLDMAFLVVGNLFFSDFMDSIY